MSTSFDPTKKALPELLSSVGHGKVQLPDFQRSWVWSDEHIRGLLSSVSLSYPIGAVMMLEAGGEVRFKVRPLEGVTLPNTGLGAVQPDFLLLDGQQRLTSLYQALLGVEAVLTRDPRGKEIRRWYYVDMVEAMNPHCDREDAFVSLPPDRKRRNFRGDVLMDYSTPELEVAGELFPLRLLLDSSAYEDWADLYKEQSPEHKARWKSFKEAVLEPFRRYQVPVIQMGKSTPKEAVCQIFEKVNTGGVSLTVFELVTAGYAADDYNLREDWYGVEGGQRGLKATLHSQRQLEGLESSEFLQAVTLLATYTRRQKALAESGLVSASTLVNSLEGDAPPISCKRRDLLNLKLEEYRAHRDAVAGGFKSAARFLHAQKLFVARDLPYRTQLIPLAAVLAVMGPQAESVGLQTKLARWFWCGVFGELYASATETRFGKDFPELLNWLEGGEEPSTVREASFEARRLEELRSRNSAAYKGLYALLMRDGACDFRTGKPATDIAYFDENIDIHHIFPQDWCKAQGLQVKRYDCIINKTPLSSGTNRKIGGNAPSKYLFRLEHEDPGLEGQLDGLLKTHVIDVPALRTDDFETFFTARKIALLERISSAMGKEVLREVSGPMM